MCAHVCVHVHRQWNENGIKVDSEHSPDFSCLFVLFIHQNIFCSFDWTAPPTCATAQGRVVTLPQWKIIVADSSPSVRQLHLPPLSALMVRIRGRELKVKQLAKSKHQQQGHLGHKAPPTLLKVSLPGVGPLARCCSHFPSSSRCRSKGQLPGPAQATGVVNPKRSKCLPDQSVPGSMLTAMWAQLSLIVTTQKVLKRQNFFSLFFILDCFLLCCRTPSGPFHTGHFESFTFIC